MTERKNYIERSNHAAKEASRVGYWTEASGIRNVTWVKTTPVNNKWLLQHREYLDTVQDTVDIISSSPRSQLMIQSSKLKTSNGASQMRESRKSIIVIIEGKKTKQEPHSRNVFSRLTCNSDGLSRLSDGETQTQAAWTTHSCRSGDCGCSPQGWRTQKWRRSQPRRSGTWQTSSPTPLDCRVLYRETKGR